MRAVTAPDLVRVFLRWTWCRAALHRGWWLVTSVYLVVDAHLSAAQLVLIGVAQGIVSLLFEIPAGVVADTISRKWSLVISHVLMGSAMLLTGLVTGFWALILTQMLWGFAWTFASGADVAWITDELASPARNSGALDSPAPIAAPQISSVLARAGRADLTGAAAGLIVLGGLASVIGRGQAMVLAGIAILALGGYVVVRFGERNFVPTKTRRLSASWTILVRGFTLVRRSRVLLLIFAATFLTYSANIGRLYPLRLVEIGFPSDPLWWFTALGVGTLLVGALAMRLVDRATDRATDHAHAHAAEGKRLAGKGFTTTTIYVMACLTGVVGAVALAMVASTAVGCAAVLLAAGIANPITRVIGTIWVNEQTSSDVRATVHSFLEQTKHIGAIVFGFLTAIIGDTLGLPAALLASALLYIGALCLVREGPLPARK